MFQLKRPCKKMETNRYNCGQFVEVAEKEKREGDGDANDRTNGIDGRLSRDVDCCDPQRTKIFGRGREGWTTEHSRDVDELVVGT